MQPDDCQLKVGNQIGIVIIYSDYRYTIRPEAGTKISIDPKRSHVMLLLVGDIMELK